MCRVQLALNVVRPRRRDRLLLASSSRTEPAKVRPGYANFAIAEPPLKLVLIEGQGEPGTLNHLGVEVDSTDEVAAAQARLAGEGLATATEDEVACCYARAGQGVGRRPRRRAVGDLHRARRRRDARRRSFAPSIPRPARRAARDRRRRRTRAADTDRPTAAEPAVVTDLAHQPETGTGALAARPRPALVAEALGTGFLVIAVIGSGIMASRLSPDDVGLQLLENAAATAGALIALILMLRRRLRRPLQPRRHPGRPRLRRHHDPRRRSSTSPPRSSAAASARSSPTSCSTSPPSTSRPRPARRGALWLSEVVATVGLLLVIHGCVRTGRAQRRRRSPSACGSAAPTGSRPRPASPTPPSPSPAPCPTPSPASSRRRRRCSSSMQLVGAAVAFGLIRLALSRSHPRPTMRSRTRGAPCRPR